MTRKTHSSIRGAKAGFALIVTLALMQALGLLTDTLAGGLRIDLTSYVENGFPTGPAGTAPMASENILPLSIAPNIKGPSWDRLRALRTMRPPAGGKLTVTAGNSADQAHIAPILLDVRVLMGAKLVSNPDNESRYKIHPCWRSNSARRVPARVRECCAASRLWVEGGFNVNSTRKDAWKALLASNRKLKHPAETAIPEEGAMFPRGLSQ